ncbi:unnamed protein product [Moneuplotes crassus]|uniref:Uncharacterized protein n=1 Tax=Euplotes crassus TaxID=5936 RepID=A0AAD1UI38_EUPCR|nr:unnamed protein product [Moneuplotes crassus]
MFTNLNLKPLNISPSFSRLLTQKQTKPSMKLTDDLVSPYEQGKEESSCSYLPQKAVFRIKKSYESEENNTLTNDTSSTKSDKDTHSTSGLFSKFHKDLTSLGNMLKRRESVLCTKVGLSAKVLFKLAN